MKAKKILSVLVTASVMTGMLAGCGGSGDPKKTEGETGSGTDKDAEIELSMMSWHGEEEETKYYDGLKYAMDEYTKQHPNITFKYIQQPYDGYLDLLDTQYISDGAPDMVYMQPHMTKAFADKGVLLPLDTYMYGESPYAEGQRWVDTFSGGEDSFSNSKASNAQGAIMFVPMDSSPILNVGQPFFYNKDLFEKAGITELPETFEEYLETLQKLKDADIIPQACDIDRGLSWAASWICDQYGEHYMDRFFDDKYNGSDKLDLRVDKNNIAFANGYFKADDEIIMETAEALYKTGQYWQEGWTSASTDDAKNLFVMQKVAILQEGSWAYNEYKELIGDDFEWGVLPIPLITKETSEFANEGFTKPTGQQDSGFALRKTLEEDPDKLAAAIDFMQFLTSKEVQQEYAKVAVSFSPIEGVEQPEELEPFLFSTELCLNEDPLSSKYVDFGDPGIWKGIGGDFITGRTDAVTFNGQVLENSKQTAVNNCLDNMSTLPDLILEGEAKVEQLEADGAAEEAVKAQKKSVELLKLKLEMYQQYCGDL